MSWWPRSKNQGKKNNPFDCPAEIKAYDQSAQVWRDLVTLGSGSVILRVGALSGDLLALISGQPVNANVSGSPVKISGETVSIAGGINVSGQPVKVSGETVQVASGTYLASGIYVAGIGGGGQVSGAVQVSGEVIAKVSGEIVQAQIYGAWPVKISGETVSIAGGINVSGQPVKVSGEIVQAQQYGTWPVKVSGEIVQAQQYGPWGVNVSGEVQVSGIVQVASGTYLASGLYLASGIYGQVVGKISGETIIGKVSGETVQVASGAYLASGIYVAGVGGGQVSGAVIISGDIRSVLSGVVIGQNQAYDLSAGIWRNLTTLTSGSQVLRVGALADDLIVRISGQIVSLPSTQPVKISGETVSVASGAYLASGLYVRTLDQQISGAVIISGDIRSVLSGLISIASGGYLASGLYVRVLDSIVSGGVIISGDIRSVLSGQVRAYISGDTIIGKVSGEIVTTRESAPTGISGAYTQLAGSGAVFPTVAGVSFIIKNLSGNASVWLGGAGVNSGKGLILEGSEAVNLDVDNLNRVYGFALTSGQRVSWIGINW